MDKYEVGDLVCYIFNHEAIDMITGITCTEVGFRFFYNNDSSIFHMDRLEYEKRTKLVSTLFRGEL